MPRSVAGMETLTPEQARAADVNRDAQVDVKDAIKIMRVIATLDPGF